MQVDKLPKDFMLNLMFSNSLENAYLVMIHFSTSQMQIELN